MKYLLLLLVLNVAYSNYVELDLLNIPSDNMLIHSIEASEGEQIKASHLNKKMSALAQAVLKERSVLYLYSVAAPDFVGQQPQSNTYTQIPIIDKSGDFGSLLNNIITLESGIYELRIPICANENIGNVSIMIRDNTSGGSQEFIDIVENHYSTTNICGGVVVSSTLTLSEISDIEILQKSSNLSGLVFVGRIQIIRR